MDEKISKNIALLYAIKIGTFKH